MNKPFYIVHAIGDDPIIEKIADKHVMRGSAYIVPSKDYVISKTEGELLERIKTLEEQRDEQDEKIKTIIKLLCPDYLSEED